MVFMVGVEKDLSVLLLVMVMFDFVKGVNFKDWLFVFGIGIF